MFCEDGLREILQHLARHRRVVVWLDRIDEADMESSLALDQLPQDLFHDNQSRPEAHRRLKASQPRHSPFALVRALNGEFSAED